MPKAPATPAPPAEPASYEAALEELEQLVARIESGQLPLDQMLAGYQRGAALLAFCRQRLEAVQDQIKVLDDGQLSLKLPDAKEPTAVSAEELLGRLSGIAAQDKDVRVIVAADRAVAYEKVVDAMDVIKRAKIEKVGLATDAR